MNTPGVHVLHSIDIVSSGRRTSRLSRQRPVPRRNQLIQSNIADNGLPDFLRWWKSIQKTLYLLDSRGRCP